MLSQVKLTQGLKSFYDVNEGNRNSNKEQNSSCQRLFAYSLVALLAIKY